jgi:hypothetical protein
MNMVQTTHYSVPEPPHPLGEPRPDNLPISAEVWDAAKNQRHDQRTMARILYQAIKQLETEVTTLKEQLTGHSAT